MCFGCEKLGSALVEGRAQRYQLGFPASVMVTSVIVHDPHSSSLPFSDKASHSQAVEVLQSQIFAFFKSLRDQDLEVYKFKVQSLEGQGIWTLFCGFRIAGLRVLQGFGICRTTMALRSPSKSSSLRTQ